MKIFEVEWNEPNLGVCQAWKVSENWFGFSAPGYFGETSTFEKAMSELENYIADLNEGRNK